MTRINRNGVSFESDTLALRDSCANTEMYALKNLSGVLSGEKPRGGAWGLFPGSRLRGIYKPLKYLLRHTFLP